MTAEQLARRLAEQARREAQRAGRDRRPRPARVGEHVRSLLTARAARR